MIEYHHFGAGREYNLGVRNCCSSCQYYSDGGCLWLYKCHGTWVSLYVRILIMHTWSYDNDNDSYLNLFPSIARKMKTWWGLNKCTIGLCAHEGVTGDERGNMLLSCEWTWEVEISGQKVHGDKILPLAFLFSDLFSTVVSAFQVAPPSSASRSGNSFDNPG